jgi:hypothetical protein
VKTIRLGIGGERTHNITPQWPKLYAGFYADSLPRRCWISSDRSTAKQLNYRKLANVIQDQPSY